MISQLGKFLLSRGGWEVLTSQLLELWESQGSARGCWAPQGQKCWWSQSAGVVGASRPPHLWIGNSGTAA